MGRARGGVGLGKGKRGAKIEWRVRWIGYKLVLA